MTKYGLILPNLRNSQITYLGINQCNAYKNAVVFYMEESPPCVPLNVCTMHVHEIWNFDGTLIATNLNGAELCIKRGGNHIFYVNELEWLKNQNYLKNYALYNNPSLKLVTRTDSYVRYIENYCNRRPSVNKLLDLRML